VTPAPHGSIPKLRTHIEGFDLISHGGLPQGRCTLLSGTSGSGKTVIGAQFLALGVLKAEQAGVFVTFEEAPEDIRRNMAGFGWDIPAWEAADRWAFVRSGRAACPHSARGEEGERPAAGAGFPRRRVRPASR
jgi:KaiC/GvpD/RAD55 family RecA-like ATPase